MIYRKKDSTKSHTRDQRDKNFSLLKVTAVNTLINLAQESFEVLITELKLLTDYVNINLEAFQKILKKQHKLVPKFFPNDLKGRFEKYLIETKAFSMRDRLNNFLYAVENEYINNFYKNREEGIGNLRRIFHGNLISRNEIFWFGLYLGFATLLIIVLVILAWNDDLDLDNDTLFKEIFPIFRGMILILLYIWLLAWNVYGWSSNYIDYKLIFRFNHHHSQLSQILKRVACFSTALIVLLLWYLIKEGHTGKFAKAIDWMPSNVIPLLVWIFFIGYMFFPHPRILNGQGRWYVWRILWNIFKSPLQPVTFQVIWATDQLASLVLPLKDLEYTICFYFEYFFSEEKDVHHCQSSERISRGVIVALIPLALRCIQCLRQIYDNKQNRRDPLVNLGKYLTSAISSILSYVVAINHSSFSSVLAWTLFAAASTVYSYVWDLKKDWGFLVPKAKHRFLRDRLAYGKLYVYYMAMIGNLVMRLAWVFSISPGVISQILRPELFTLIIGFVEALRRAAWNFFRVEKEHLANVGNFVVVQEMKLPYSDLSFYDTKDEEGLFAEELKVIMEDDHELRKPISTAGYTHYSTGMDNLTKRQSELTIESPESESRRSEADELIKLKHLSELNLDPRSLLKQKRDLKGELVKYKKAYPQLTLLKKQIVDFKQHISKKSTKFEVVTTRRSDIGLFKRDKDLEEDYTSKSRNIDEQMDIRSSTIQYRASTSKIYPMFNSPHHENKFVPSIFLRENMNMRRFNKSLTVTPKKNFGVVFSSVEEQESINSSALEEKNRMSPDQDKNNPDFDPKPLSLKSPDRPSSSHDFSIESTSSPYFIRSGTKNSQNEPNRILGSPSEETLTLNTIGESSPVHSIQRQITSRKFGTKRYARFMRRNATNSAKQVLRKSLTGENKVQITINVENKVTETKE